MHVGYEKVAISTNLALSRKMIQDRAIVTSNVAVAKRPRTAQCFWKYCCHSRAFEFTPL